MSMFFTMAPYAVAYTIPILITALGGMFAERSGIINIALDGIMIIGALTGVLSVTLLADACGSAAAAAAGILLAVLMGMLFSLLLAFASVHLNADQTICGTALNLMAAALSVYLSRQIVGVSIIIVNSLPRFDIPLLSSIPIIGQVLFQKSYVTTWLVLALTVLSWYVMERTPFGLRLRAGGGGSGRYPCRGDTLYRCADFRRVRWPGRSGICADSCRTVHRKRQWTGLCSAGGTDLRTMAHLPGTGFHPVFRFCADGSADLHPVAFPVRHTASVP